MKAIHSTLLALAATLAAGASFAQAKPPARAQGPAAAPARAASAPAAAPADTSPATKEKETAATLSASGWLSLLDRRDWGRAWETSASLFRSTVPLPNWMDGIPQARDLGNFIQREADEAIYSPTLEGRPNGDYVTVFYSSKFSKKEDVVEIVTTVREPDGKWRVTGYQTR